MQHFNDTFTVSCHFLLFTPGMPKKPGIEETFAGCFLSMSLSPLNASLRLRGTFQLQTLFVFSLVTARKAWNFLRYHFLTGQMHLFSQQCILLSKKCLHVSWSPIEAAEELEVAKSVEMSEEAVRKSIFVESLEHCVVPTSDVDHALVGEDLDLEGSKMMNKNCDVDIEGSKKWHDGGKRMNEVRDEAEKAAVHSTKKGSLDKLTPQDGPIKITSVKLCHRWWFEKKKDFRGLWRKTFHCCLAKRNAQIPEVLDIAHLSLPWSISWVALSFLVRRLFVVPLWWNSTKSPFFSIYTGIEALY